MSFGSYNVFASGPLDTTSTITGTCTIIGSYNITVTLSTGSSGSYTPRAMTNGTDQLQYNIYTDSARTQIFGNGTGGTSDLTLSGPFAFGTYTQTVTLYGRIFAGQNVPAGAYTDTITATIMY